MCLTKSSEREKLRGKFEVELKRPLRIKTITTQFAQVKQYQRSKLHVNNQSTHAEGNFCFGS